jgi:hypothetical protein
MNLSKHCDCKNKRVFLNENCIEKNLKKQNRGITLIALVIIIIVLLILSRNIDICIIGRKWNIKKYNRFKRNS